MPDRVFEARPIGVIARSDGVIARSDVLENLASGLASGLVWLPGNDARPGFWRWAPAQAWAGDGWGGRRAALFRPWLGAP